MTGTVAPWETGRFIPGICSTVDADIALLGFFRSSSSSSS